MILILIGIIVGIAYAICEVYNEYYKEFWDYVWCSFLIGLFGAIIAFFIASMLPMDTYGKKHSLSIETLQDNSTVNGNFFLGCGQVEGKMKYSLYCEENGLYRMIQLDYDLVQIKYSKNKPKIVVIENYPSKAFINYFAIDFDVYRKTYIIEVPKGTIRNNFNLDTK